MCLYRVFSLILCERTGDTRHVACLNVSVVSESLAHLPDGGVLKNPTLAIDGFAICDHLAVTVINQQFNCCFECRSSAMLSCFSVALISDDLTIYRLIYHPRDLMNVTHQPRCVGLRCLMEGFSFLGELINDCHGGIHRFWRDPISG